MQKGFVYILKSAKNEKYYIGSTIDVEKRLIEHNNGYVKATKYLLPWKLEFFKEYPDIRQARQVEYKLKKFKSRKIIERIVVDGDIKTGP